MMNIDFKEIHNKSGWHESDILNSKICGCFHCLNIYPPQEITEWINENPECPRGSGRTAICPKCGIDSVLPDTINYEINKELLDEMRIKYFT